MFGTCAAFESLAGNAVKWPIISFARWNLYIARNSLNITIIFSSNESFASIAQRWLQIFTLYASNFRYSRQFNLISYFRMPAFRFFSQALPCYRGWDIVCVGWLLASEFLEISLREAYYIKISKTSNGIQVSTVWETAMRLERTENVTRSCSRARDKSLKNAFWSWS